MGSIVVVICSGRDGMGFGQGGYYSICSLMRVLGSIGSKWKDLDDGIQLLNFVIQCGSSI